MADKTKGAKFIQSFINEFNESINVAWVCRVVNFDGRYADVQPLEQDGDGNKQTNMLQNCEVIQQARQQLIPIEDGKVKVRKLQKGDEVIVLFTDGDLDNYLGGEYKPLSNRMHSFNDGVVIGNL